MGVLDKLLDAVKLNDDYDDDDFLDDDMYDDDDDFLDDEEDKPVKKFFQKFTKKKEDDFDDDDFDDEPVVKPAKSTTRTSVTKPVTSSVSTAKVSVRNDKPVRTQSKITPMRSTRKGSSSPSMEVRVISPKSMEDTRTIADTLVDNATVILNLEGIDLELAQRIIDFTSGACYSLGGSLQKVSSYIFILGPYNVDITGDLQSILGGSSLSVRAGY